MVKHKKDEHTWSVAYYTLTNGSRTAVTEHCRICDKFRTVPYNQPETKGKGPMIFGLSSGERPNQ